MGRKNNAIEYFVEPDARKRYLRALQQNDKLDRYLEQMIDESGRPFPASTSARMFEFQGQPVIGVRRIR